MQKMQIAGVYTEPRKQLGKVMTPKQADKKLEQIEKLAREIELDGELKQIDERYSFCAKWIETDINDVSLD